MTPGRRRASRSCAQLVRSTDGVERVRFYCHICDAEQVTQPIKLYQERKDRLGHAWCLVCGGRVWLRIVGPCPDVWSYGDHAIWQIDGPEVCGDEPICGSASAGPSAAQAAARKGGK